MKLTDQENNLIDKERGCITLVISKIDKVYGHLESSLRLSKDQLLLLFQNELNSNISWVNEAMDSWKFFCISRKISKQSYFLLAVNMEFKILTKRWRMCSNISPYRLRLHAENLERLQNMRNSTYHSPNSPARSPRHGLALEIIPVNMKILVFW